MRYAQLDPEKAFLGVGWAYPLQLTAENAFLMKAYEADIQEAIQIILGTNHGERVMRPDFGAGLKEFVFEPLSTTTLSLVQNRVQESLSNWEPRIDVHEVVVTSDKSNRKEIKLLINISYQVRVTNTHHNLVYPFYLQEGSAQ